MAAVLAVALFALAGIPLTAGFPAKFFVLTTGVQQHLWLPVIVLVVTSVFGLYYYLRIISTLFAAPLPAEIKEKKLHPFFYNATYATLLVLMVLLCGLGIYPEIIVKIVRDFLSVH